MSSRNIAGFLFYLSLGTVTTALHAQTPVESIARINENIALLNAQKAELDVKAQIAQKQAEIDRVSGANMFAAGSYQSMPVIRGIEGVDGRLSATLAYGRGSEQTVRAGEKIRGNWKVGHIDVRSVTLVRGKEQVKLTFGDEPAAAFSATVPPTLPGSMPAGR